MVLGEDHNYEIIVASLVDIGNWDIVVNGHSLQLRSFSVLSILLLTETLPFWTDWLEEGFIC